MSRTDHRPTFVQLRTGERLSVCEDDFNGLFLAVLGRTLAEDYHSPCPLSDWEQVRLACEREIQFLAGQLARQRSTLIADMLRDEFCCWEEELRSSIPTAPK